MGDHSFFPLEDKTSVIAMACKNPKDFTVKTTHWSIRLLVIAIAVHLKLKISFTSIQKLLKDAKIKPHKMKYYLNCKDPDLIPKSRLISKIYQTKLLKNWVILCVDEKTGIQALERKFQETECEPRKIKRREFEYVRHGTRSLLGFFNIKTGEAGGLIRKKHTQYQFIDLLDLIRKKYRRKKILIVLDNLQTHKTPNVMKWLSKQRNKKGQSMVRFVFLPKHASWLNQIEIWFSILSYHSLKFGNFLSCNDLRNKITNYIKYYNKTAHPFAWTYKGLPLQT